MNVLRVMVRVSMALSLSLVFLAANGCGGSQGDIGASGSVPADVPDDSDAAIAEIEAAGDDT